MADNIKLDENQVESKKKIGSKDGNPVWQIVTKGGLYVNAIAKGGKFDILGTGPHPAIARHISENRLQGIHWSGLSKSDFVPLCDYESMLPEFIELTDRMIAAQKKK